MVCAERQRIPAATLTVEKQRIFSAERMCFRSDGFWLTFLRPMPLPELVESRCGHLGQESFYEIGL